MLGFVLVCPNLYPWSFGQLKPYGPVQLKVHPSYYPRLESAWKHGNGMLIFEKRPCVWTTSSTSWTNPDFPPTDHADTDQNTSTAGNSRCWTQVRCWPQPFHYDCTQRETSESEGMKYSVGLCHDKPRSPWTFLWCFFTSENMAATIFSVHVNRMYRTMSHSPQLPYSRLQSPYPWMWGHYGGCLSKKTSLTQTGKGETTSASLRQSQKLKGRTDIPVASVSSLFVWFLKKANFGESLYG